MMRIRLVLALGAALGLVSVAQAEQTPLKIGAMMPLSGPFSALGQYTREGLELYLAQHGGMLGGRKVDVDWADDTNVPHVGLTQVRRLVEQDRVDLVFGPVAANVGAAMCSFSGQTAINFMKQYREFGVTIPVICQGNATDESTLGQEGPAAEGIVTALHTKAYGHGPSYYGEGGYVAAEFLDKARAATHGVVGDPVAFVANARKVNVRDAPRGPISMDAYGNPVENVYIRKVEMRNGVLQNGVLRTYTNVTQFWTFSPEQFLVHPLCDRSYPACNPCSG